MRRFIVWLATAATLYVLVQVHMGIEASSVGAVVVASVVLGLVNLIIRPIVRLLTLPLRLMTLGLFGFVINALMVWLAAALVPGFRVNGFLSALWASIILAIVSGVVNWLVRRRSTH